MPYVGEMSMITSNMLPNKHKRVRSIMGDGSQIKPPLSSHELKDHQFIKSVNKGHSIDIRASPRSLNLKQTPLDSDKESQVSSSGLARKMDKDNLIAENVKLKIRLKSFKDVQEQNATY